MEKWSNRTSTGRPRALPQLHRESRAHMRRIGGAALLVDGAQVEATEFTSLAGGGAPPGTPGGTLGGAPGGAPAGGVRGGRAAPGSGFSGRMPRRARAMSWVAG